MYKQIVVGTDLSKTAAVATHRAGMLASLGGAGLIVVHAGADPGEPLRASAERYEAEVVVEQGSPAEVLISVAEERGADLLVVGSVGMSGARRFLLGSVPNKVSHHAPTDLLIVKTDPPPRDIDGYAEIVVGTDGSETATKALDAACDLAVQLDAKVTVVCAYEPLTEREKDQLKADPNDPVAQWSVPRETRSVPDEVRWRIAAQPEAEGVLERAADRASRRGLDVSTRAVEGNPVDVLIGLAADERFEVIVVGSVGMRGAKRFMLGNVPHRISHHSPTDVLIVKTA